MVALFFAGMATLLSPPSGWHASLNGNRGDKSVAAPSAGWLRLFAEDFFHVTDLALHFAAGFVGCAARLHVAALCCLTHGFFHGAFGLFRGSFDFVCCA